MTIRSEQNFVSKSFRNIKYNKYIHSKTTYSCLAKTMSVYDMGQFEMRPLPDKHRVGEPMTVTGEVLADHPVDDLLSVGHGPPLHLPRDADVPSEGDLGLDGAI